MTMLDGILYAQAQQALLTAQPCNEPGCDHTGIALHDGRIYCGTHAWTRRYPVTR